jgi:VWFA-related protein
VVGFNHGVTVLQDLSNDVPALQAAVGRAGANGSTSLYTAVYIALRQFGRPAVQANQVRRQAIVALTDGEENTSGLAFEDLLDEARSRGVAVYAIMLQSESLGERERIEGRLMPTRRAMKELARETGALAYFPKRAIDLLGVYETIAAELTSQYSMAYVPQAAGHDSALRQIAIRVATRPGLRTRARTAYLSGGRALRLVSQR